jgi:hypothetical protein
MDSRSTARTPVLGLRVTTLAAACALALVAPSAARADHGQVVDDPTLLQYLQVAREHWGGQEPRCPGPNGQSIAPHAVMADDPDPAVGAWAEVPGCRIWLDATHWPAAPSEPHCNLIAHEWGHLLGHEHSPDSTSLMWASWINNVVLGCQAFRVQPPPPPGPAPTVAAAPRKKKPRKLREKVRRGRQRCVRIRRTKVRRHRRSLKRLAPKRCARKGAKRRSRKK